MAQLYANENFPRQVVEGLRSLGHDVLTVQEAGNAGLGIDDKEVLTFATERNRAVITINRRDFIRLHATQPDHAGLLSALKTLTQMVKPDESTKLLPL